MQVAKSVSPTSTSDLPMHSGQRATKTARMGGNSTGTKSGHGINDTAALSLSGMQ